MAYELSYNNGVDSTSLPDVASVLTAARALLDSTEQWSLGKKYHGMVQMLYKKVSGEASWFVRVSEHDPKDGVTFEDLWRAVGVDHAINESQFIPELDKATLLQSFEAGQLEAWDLFYKFAPPISSRRFDVLLIINRPDVIPREGLIVSIPYEPNTEEASKTLDAVRGKYCSVERIKELADGKVEWRTAAQSTAGGSIPLWVQEMSMPSKISEDVPNVLKWLKEHPAPTS